MNNILIIILIMNMLSCKEKNEDVQINGKIYDPNTKCSVENATVTISAQKLENGVYNSGYSEISTLSTDSEGNFEIIFSKEKVASYKIYVVKSGYFSYSEIFSPDDIPEDNIYYINCDIYPYGFINLYVENKYPVNSSDYISYNFSSGAQSCIECCDNTMIYGYGEDYISNLTCKTYGNQNITVSYFVTKNSLTVGYEKIVYCLAFDTTDCIIEY